MCIHIYIYIYTYIYIYIYIYIYPGGRRRPPGVPLPLRPRLPLRTTAYYYH